MNIFSLPLVDFFSCPALLLLSARERSVAAAAQEPSKSSYGAPLCWTSNFMKGDWIWDADKASSKVITSTGKCGGGNRGSSWSHRTRVWFSCRTAGVLWLTLSHKGKVKEDTFFPVFPFAQDEENTGQKFYQEQDTFQSHHGCFIRKFNQKSSNKSQHITTDRILFYSDFSAWDGEAGSSGLDWGHRQTLAMSRLLLPLSCQ